VLARLKAPEVTRETIMDSPLVLAEEPLANV
jgi:hypothetical protein